MNEPRPIELLADARGAAFVGLTPAGAHAWLIAPRIAERGCSTALIRAFVDDLNREAFVDDLNRKLYRPIRRLDR